MSAPPVKTPAKLSAKTSGNPGGSPEKNDKNEEKKKIFVKKPKPIKYQNLQLLVKGLADVKDPTLASISYSSLLLAGLTKSDRLKRLYSMISNYRMFTRVYNSADLLLWGFGELDTAQIKTTNILDEAILRLQVWSSLAYQLLEDIAYLSSHRVIRLSQKLENKIWIWSCIMWSLYVQLELLRIAKDAFKGKPVDLRNLFINLAWSPLTIHWSTANGFLNDVGVGFFGSCAVIPKAIAGWTNVLSGAN